ncbi:MAG: alpha/beta fold hydrolase [Vulcanimicrobiaceae bacterium]
MSTAAVHTVRTPDGVALAYHLRGADRDERRRLVLIHSLGLSHLIWESVAERLADRAQVLLYDCRGHGGSGKPAGPYTLELFASDLAVLLDHLGWETAVVGGCSMGGSVALRFASAYPTRIAGLGLADTTAWYGPDAVASWGERAERARSAGLPAMVGFQETRWFSDAFRAARPDLVARCRQTFLANDVAAFAASCEMLGAFDLRATLGAIAVPTAVVVGEEDYATPPAMARALHDAIAGSSLEIIPAGRHITPVERPDALAQTLGVLLERVAR